MILAGLVLLALEHPLLLLLQPPRPHPAPEGAAGGPCGACGGRSAESEESPGGSVIGPGRGGRGRGEKGGG